ncbi:alpha/beta hydrolase family protein [Actinoplanes sp. NPDC049599]|uniref:alpha/beta hydrolase family protein n=1 Tax=Actinoplanes sp. NPDC049599 TaxID=3363903 RepID=UPI00379AC7C6
MGRRTFALLLAAACATGALTSCSADSGGEPTPAAPAASQNANLSAAPSAIPSLSAKPTRGTAPAKAFSVKTRKLQLSRGKGRPLPTTVWFPATGKGPFPVIVFSHGLTGRPSDYNDLLTPWARAGFVVAAPAYPHTSAGTKIDYTDVLNQPADASYVLTKVLDLGSKKGDPLAGRLDPDHVAAAGHSAGGITTLGMLSGTRDDRLAAAVVLAGRVALPGTFTGPAVPVLFVHGKLDRTVPYADGLAAFKAVPWSKALLTLPTAGHIVSSGKQFTLMIDSSTDFWRWSLYGDAGALKRLERRDNLDSTL